MVCFSRLYQQYLIDLVNSGRYDHSDDFTVVIQPFMAHTQVPIVKNTDKQQIDFSYFAPDCFHFSGLFSNLHFLKISLI